MKFYLQRTDADGVAVEVARSLEEYFDGVKYLSCTGLEDRGEIKNVYTEDYADYNGLRTFHPSDIGKEVTRKETTIKLTLLFLGDKRRESFGRFVNHVSRGRFYWWDTVRNKKAWLLFQKESSPQEDVVKGIPYIKVEFTFTNIWGETKSCDDAGELK